MPFSRLSAASAGIAFYLTGVFFFAVNDALGKWLMADYSVGQLLLLRSTGAVVVLVVLGWRERAGIFHADQIGLNLLRVACMAGDTFAFYYATKALPLADVMTFYMAAPLIVTALSGPLLGEQVGAARWGAVLVGFGGVLVALHPTSAAFSPSALIALFGAVMFAFGVTITRQLRATHWLPLVSWQFAGAGLVGAATSPFAWVHPSLFDLGLMFLVGIVAMLCFTCITRALALAPASLLAPFQYSALVWAVILGFLVWGDIPTPAIAIGNAIIIGSGLFVFYSEQGRARAAALPADAK
ncbi:DMT family transporter [Labrys wisconsinensis]|uniref:S-adenosylmethionine uptake transporter n=1 Tax=Labrys wisconsinensis TaxID=425677 RepID=A0ABU0J1G9_9HYPH|nr:DMT family transporter [Labrys wisconsinensis]MDQ0468097.1 S-adenosylmethionine uptake transporter [Labrys wisconsinensis]